jgi:flagellin-like protein
MDFIQTKRGAQGIGTLIIFIALILVAAVAAGVLIQTASALQSKSLDVGRQSQEKITSDIEVVQVFASDTSDGDITGANGGDNITLVVRLGSGSNEIKLSDLILKLDTSSGTQTLTHVSGAFSATEYNATYIVTGTNNAAGYIVEGDLAQFEFTVASGTTISESDSMTIRLIAKNGAVKPVDITTPSAMVETTTYLFP